MEANRRAERSMRRLSSRARVVPPSLTLTISARVARMRAEGIDVISFGAGEPDFDTPEPIKEAAIAALRAGQTKYAKPSYGIEPAREAVCARYRRLYGEEYSPQEVMLTVGGKEGLYLAFAALLEPGDEVLVPTPYWLSYPHQIRLAGGEPVFVPGDESRGFRVDVRALATAATRRTRVLVLNYPANPSGQMYGRGDLEAIADFVLERDLWVVSDEMYDQLVFDGEQFVHFASLRPELRERTITVNAASKTYAMTGWRLGYALGPEAVIAAMAKIQSQTTSGTATFIQHALIAALSGDQSPAERMRGEFQRRRDRMCARLEELRDVRVLRPEGSFYCFPNVSGTYERLGVRDSLSFAERLLEEAHVAVVPGVSFGSDIHVRFSFACSLEDIDRGMDRIAALIGRR